MRGCCQAFIFSSIKELVAEGNVITQRNIFSLAVRTKFSIMVKESFCRQKCINICVSSND